MSERWELIDGYNQEHRYINQEGQIVGIVVGSPYSNHGWYARTDTPEITRLGRFTTSDMAKRAVERAIGARKPGGNS